MSTKAKKQIAADSFLGFQYVSDPTFSPNGTKACFVVQKASLEDNRYRGNLYLLDVESKAVRQLTQGDDAFSYTWTKEGKILFSVKRTKEEKESEDTTFYEIDPSFGEAYPAFSLPVKAGRLIEAKKDLYVLQATENLGEPLKERAYEIIEESPFWFNGRAFTQGLRGRIYTYHRQSGKLTAITDKTFDAGLIDANENYILYRGADWKKGKKYERAGLYLYDLKKEKRICLIRPETKHFGYAAFFKPGKLLLGIMDPKKNPYMYNADFYEFDIESKKAVLFKEYDRSMGSSVGSDARLGGGRSAKVFGDKLYFIATEEEGAYLHTLSKSGTLSKRLSPDGSLDSFDVSKHHLLTCGLFGNKLAELYLDQEQVTHFNDEFEESFDIRTPEYHEFINSDGVSIHGYALTPRSYQKGSKKKYPCILHVHGGPATVFGSVYHHEMQLWANAGYFVIFCNPRGSDGRGGAFADICDKYGSIDYQDIMDFTDEMLKKYPAIDKKRVGITGGSYGGFMTNWVIGHTDRFKAACSQRSIADWTMFEHTSDIGYGFTYYHQGSRTRENVEKLWAHSPLQFAPSCTTPTLFIHSDKDMRCWMVEGISMFNALQMNGCDSRLVLFHDETHELSRSGKPKNRIKRMEEILAWFDKYLK